MRNGLAASVAIACLAGLSACTNPETSELGLAPDGTPRVNSAGPVQMLSAGTEAFSTARLAGLIEAGAGLKSDTLPTDADGPAAIQRLDRALMGFAQAPYSKDADKKSVQNQLRDVRNTIQAQLIAASNNRCNVYKTHIRRLSSNSGFFLGGLATAAGAAGAIVTGTASQALAGSASALSGVNAEFQKDFFNGLVTSVIIPGIDRQRADLRNDMVGKSCASVTDYPLTLAISEAIRYHGACSADVGIAASGQAVARSSSDSLSTVLAAAGKARKIADAATTLTNAEAARVAGNAAKLESLRDSALTQLNNKVAQISNPPAGADVSALVRERDALQKTYDGLKAQAAYAVAAKQKLDTKSVDSLSTSGDQPGATWSPGDKPLVGDVLQIPTCAPLDENGRAIAGK